MGVRLPRWPLTARERQLERLVAVVGDRGGAVVLTGAAGVGKTRLLEETVQRATAAGRPVHWVACTSASTDIPFGALSHLLPVPERSAVARFELLGWARRAITGDGAGDGPVLAIDDGHLLDDGSATLVHQLVLRGDATVLVSVRTGERAPEPLQRLWKDGLAGRLDLLGLTADEARELVTTVLGGPVHPRILDRLWQLSGGNPLFLRELVLGGLAAGTLSASETGIWRLQGPLRPSLRLREIVDVRLQRLADAEREAAETLALAGPLDLSVLTAVATVDTIERLEEREVVVVADDHTTTTVRVAHPLYGEMLTDQLPTMRRRRLAAAVADAIASVHGTTDPVVVLRLGRLRLIADDPTDPALFTSAARRALASFDYPLAERLARAAIRHGGDAFQPCLALGKALARQNRPEEAEAAFDRAADHVTVEPDRTRLALARARSRFFRARQPAAAQAVLDDALATATRDDCRDELEAMAALFASLLGDLPRAVAAGDRILARPDAHPRTVRTTLAVSVFSQVLRGRFDDARDAISVGLEAAAPADPTDPFLTADLLRTYQAMLTAYSGGIAAAERDARASFEEVMRHRIDVAGPWGDVLCHILILRGAVAEAGEVADQTMQLLSHGDPFGVGAMTLGGWATAASLQGDAGAVEALVSRIDAAAVRGDPRPAIFADLARARVQATTGDLSGGARLAAEAGRRAVDRGNLVWGSLLLHEAVRLDHPELVLTELVDVTAGLDGELLPLFATHAEQLAGGSGDALEEVSHRYESLGALLHAAEAAGQAARQHRSQGRARRARRAAARAHALALRCPGASAPTLAASDEQLTRREREIALLAAGGHPSREIAERLVISRRTVDNHLRSVYAKLGVDGRDALPALLAPGTTGPPRP